MLVLDKAAIVARLDPLAALAAVRASLVAQSRGEAVSDLIHLDFPTARGDAHVKTGWAKDAPIFVVKVATGFYDNPARNLPSSNGVVLAFSARTGEPIALLQDEGYLTNLRTGLAGAIATLRLWPAGATTLGIVGSGAQARMQLEGLRIAAPDLRCEVQVWGRTPERVEAFISDAADIGFHVRPAASVEALCRQSGVTVTTTPARSPLVQADWVVSDAHVTAIGADAPGKQELDADLSARAVLLAADSRAQSISHGEFSHAVTAQRVAPERIIEIGALLESGALRPEGLTIADLTGLGAEDAAMAVATLGSEFGP